MLAIFMDIETTGLDPFYHSILEIAFKIIDISTGKEKISYQKIVKQNLENWEKRDLTSVEVNGFTWEKVQQGQIQEEIKKEIIDIFLSQKIERGSAVYICQNPAFDRNFFAQLIDVYTQENYRWPYHWLDFASMFWALQMKRCYETQEAFPQEINLSKNSIAQLYQLPIETWPHGAMNGVDHLILCYQTVVGFGPLLNYTSASA